jgi:hypothetical protein
MKKLIAITLILATSACATQRYGRATDVSTIEKKELDCKQVNIEIGKAEEFIADIKRQRLKTNGAHILGFLGDFGLGNAMEGNAAELSGETRLKQLKDLKATKACK